MGKKIEVSPLIKNKNIYQRIQGSLNPSDRRASAIEKVENKEYAKEYFSLHLVYWIIFVALLIIAIFLGQSGVNYIFSEYVNVYVLTIVAILFIAGFYILEYLNLSKLFIIFARSNKGERPPVLSRIGFAVFISLFNIGIVFLGVYNLTNKEISTANTNISYNIAQDSLNIANEYNTEITRYLSLIEEVQNNPQGWINGKRSVLTQDQLNMISSYDNYIVELRATKEQKIMELKENKNTQITQSTENKFNWFYVKIAVALFIEICIIVFIKSITSYYIGIWKEAKLLEELEGRKVNEKSKDKNTNELDEEFSEKFGEELSGKGGDEKRTRITGEEPFDISDWQLKN
jgi:hypothetical protein